MLQQLMEALRAAVEPEDARAAAVQVGHREHLAADVAVAYPIDEVMAPVHRLRHVRERETDFADALVIHEESLGRNESAGKTKLRSVMDAIRQFAVQ